MCIPYRVAETLLFIGYVRTGRTILFSHKHLRDLRKDLILERFLLSWCSQNWLFSDQIAWENSRHFATSSGIGFPAKWNLRNECRNSTLMTRLHPNLYRSAVFSGYVSESTPSPILKMRVDGKTEMVHCNLILNGRRRTTGVHQASLWQRAVRKMAFRLSIPHSRRYKGNGYKLSAKRLLGLFGQTSVTYDWLMVALDTIDQS